MTAQTLETLILDGALEDMGTRPLDEHPIVRTFDFRAHSDVWNTACHRGYQGVWEVHDGRLWLVGLFDALSEPLDTRPIFGEQALPIPADWFSGALLLLRGPRLMYAHFGWGGIYSTHLRLYFRDGVLQRRRCYDQRKLFRNRFDLDLLREALSRPPEGPGSLSWFTRAGFDALEIDPATIAPGHEFSLDDEDDDEPPRPWDWELERIGQCRRPASAPPIMAPVEGSTLSGLKSVAFTIGTKKSTI